jgi:hypothetical protein
MYLRTGNKCTTISKRNWWSCRPKTKLWKGGMKRSRREEGAATRTTWTRLIFFLLFFFSFMVISKCICMCVCICLIYIYTYTRYIHVLISSQLTSSTKPKLVYTASVPASSNYQCYCPKKLTTTRWCLFLHLFLPEIWPSFGFGRFVRYFLSLLFVVVVIICYIICYYY